MQIKFEILLAEWFEVAENNEGYRLANDDDTRFDSCHTFLSMLKIFCSTGVYTHV